MAWDLELQPYSVAYGPNSFVQSWALGLLKPQAQASYLYAQFKAHQACNFTLYISWFITRDLPSQRIYVGNVNARGCYISTTWYCLREYHCRTSLLGWEPIPKPLLLLPTRHPLKSNGIGPPCPLIILSNHNPSTNLEL